MNHITIASYKDFDEILKETLTVINDSFIADKFEYPDMWCLSFTPEFFKELGYDKLVSFFKILIETRETQLRATDFKKTLTFYLWFDEQALQLRFNIISGEGASLPFGCTVNKVGSIEPILNKFFSIINDVIEGKDFFEVCDVQDIEDAADDESPENYVLDVYVQTLYPQHYIQ